MAAPAELLHKPTLAVETKPGEGRDGVEPQGGGAM